MQTMKVHQHWARRVEYWVVMFAAVISSLANAHAVWWFFSTSLNWVDGLQWIVSILLAVGFTAIGFVVSRGLAHRIQHHQKKGFVCFVAVIFGLLEMGCCFVLAAYGIQHIVWLVTFKGLLYNVILTLCYLLLPITPWFTILLAWFEVNLDKEKHGNQAPVPHAAVKGAPALSVLGNGPFPPRVGAPAPHYVQGFQAGSPIQPSYPSVAGYQGTSSIPLAPSVGAPGQQYGTGYQGDHKSSRVIRQWLGIRETDREHHLSLFTRRGSKQ